MLFTITTSALAWIASAENSNTSWSASNPNPNVFSVEPTSDGPAVCGFLNAPLFYEEDSIYKNLTAPAVKVYACIIPAKEQPAKGTVFCHPGGPGSTSALALATCQAAKLDTSHNIIGFDQRGLGRSLPSFFSEECRLPEVEGANAGYTRGTPPGHAGTGRVTAREEEQMRAFLKGAKTRAKRCYANPAFQFEGRDAEGQPVAFNWLQHSGTRQLVHDVKLLMEAIGESKLSVYGQSYGTQVAAAFATMYPQHTERMVIDSTMPPIADALQFADDFADGADANFDRVAFSCETAPGGCPLGDDPAGALRTVFQHLATGGATGGVYEAEAGGATRVARPPLLLAQAMYRFVSQSAYYQLPTYVSAAVRRGDDPRAGLAGLLKQIGELHRALGRGDRMTFDEVLLSILPVGDKERATPMRTMRGRRLRGAGASATTGAATAASSGFDPQCPAYVCKTVGAPTQMQGQSDLPTGHENTAQALILSQDTAHNCQSEAKFVREWKRVAARSTGLGSGLPAHLFATAYSLSYYFPNPTPLAPLANPTTRGLVVGHVYDAETPYRWAQQMGAAFPSTSFLTNQALHHSTMSTTEVANMDPSWGGRARRGCFQSILDYFESGNQPVTGSVCLTPPPVVTESQLGALDAAAAAAAAN